MSDALEDFPTARRIYEQLTTGPGSESLRLAQATTQDERQENSRRVDLITKLTADIRTGWRGTSSDAAYGAAQSLAQAAIQGTDQLDQARDLLDRQLGAFHRAANSVREIPPAPPEDPLAGPNPYSVDHEREVRAYQRDEEHNLDVYGRYDEESAHNETHLPTEYPIVTRSDGSTRA